MFPNVNKDTFILSGNPKFDLIKFYQRKKKENQHNWILNRVPHINQHEGINYTFVSLMPKSSRTSNFTYADVLGFQYDQSYR